MKTNRLTKFKYGELYCGPGGLSLGAENASLRVNDKIYGMTHAWANDFDTDSCETFRNNICNGDKKSVICGDVRQLDITKLSKIDAFGYGFPCNDFSIVGERKGIHGDYGPLYSYGVKVIDYFKPRFFVAENVGGLSSANGGRALDIILNDLENAGNGYVLTKHLYKSEYYGVPQMRHRMIIVGIDMHYGLKYEIPAPLNDKDHFMTAKMALENNPIPSDSPNNEPSSTSDKVVKRLKHIKPWENAWTADLPKELQLNVKSAKLSQIYRRLHPDKPSYTITGSGGGGTHGYHYSEPRPLTNRERARIQTFPDDYKFTGTASSVRKQIGMAVPPKLAQIVFEAILKTFAGIEYPSVPSSFAKKTLELF